MGVWIRFLMLGGGASLAVGVMYLLIAKRAERPALFAWLGGLAAFGGLKALAEVRMYGAFTPDTYGPAMRWQLAISVIWALALIGFLTSYVQGARRVAAVAGVSWVVVLAVNLVYRHGIVFSPVTEVRRATLPWGEVIAIGSGPSAPLRFLFDFAGVMLLVLSVACVWVLIRRRDRKRAWLLGTSLSILLTAAFLYAPLVDSGRVDLPYIVTAAAFLLVAVMSVDLALRASRSFELAREVGAWGERWSTLLDQVQLLVVSVDRGGRIDFANPHFAQVTRAENGGPVGRRIAEFFPQSDRDEAAELFERAWAGEVEGEVELPLMTERGERREVLWSPVLLRDGDSKPVGILAVGADVTARRAAEGARDEALAEVTALKERLEEENLSLRTEVEEVRAGKRVTFPDVVGESPAMRDTLSLVTQVAETDATVLLHGETGVGKGLLAQAIHRGSRRASKPLVSVNCAALPTNLVEAELFGHVRGAFTGATTSRRGRFEAADGGTLFLDEIGELPLEVQAKLLRVLQDGSFERVGSNASISVDVRVIAATNRKLSEEVAAGRFREDLFFRLNVFPIRVPPLRERRKDIPLLVSHLIPGLAARHGRSIDEVPGSVLRALSEHDWPGNVRELANVLERAVIVSDTKLRVPPEFGQRTDDGPGAAASGTATLDEVQRAHIERVLETTGGRVSGPDGAARILGMNPSTLRHRMKKLGLVREA